jgi:multiple sugar transport system substrate-binding protein
MIKRAMAILLASTMEVSMAACGSSSSGSDAGAGSSGGDGDKTISVAIWDPNQLDGLQQIADEWGAESGYTVDFTVPGWDGYWTMLEAGVSGGEMPDVFWMHSNNAEKYMGSGVLMNLDSYIENDDSVDLNNYFEGITDLYTHDGSVYALPKDHDTIAVVYNKAIFDKYGIAYPTDDWTWEEFAATAQEISDKGKDDGVYGTYCNTGSNQDTWYNIIYSYGGEVITEDKTASGYDEPATIEAMKFVAEKILPACPSPDSMASTGGDTMFLSGLVGMICQGSWTVNNFYTADNADDFGWVMMPYADVNGNGQCEKEERCSIYNGLGWSVYSQTDEADACWSLISYLTNKESQIKQSELGVTMAGYIGCSEPFAEVFGDMDVSAFVNIEEQGTLIFRPYSKSTAIWEDDASKALVDVWSAPETMEETLHQIADKMNTTLAAEK